MKLEKELRKKIPAIFLMILSFMGSIPPHSAQALKEGKKNAEMARKQQGKANETKNGASSQALFKGSYELIWADEFDKAGKPDPQKWDFETGFIRNHELQYYTSSKKNARVRNGHLIIESRMEKVRNQDFASFTHEDWRKNRRFGEYTSASLTTKGKAAWRYGRIEVRAKLPRGYGQWPAIWMLGENWDMVGWPLCGEIDIMENVGFDPDYIHGTVHTYAYNHIKGTQKGKKVEVNEPWAHFNTYSIDWTPEKIDFYVNDRIYNSVANEHKAKDEWPFDQEFHLKLNIAIGGEWGGQKGIDDDAFPQRMLVDYVRVYQVKH